jgi:hypothetical protein
VAGGCCEGCCGVEGGMFPATAQNADSAAAAITGCWCCCPGGEGRWWLWEKIAAADVVVLLMDAGLYPLVVVVSTDCEGWCCCRFEVGGSVRMSAWWFRFLESLGAMLLVPLPVPVLPLLLALVEVVPPRVRLSSSVLTLCDRSPSATDVCIVAV